MPLLLKKRLLAAKVETTSGTVETLANADGNENFYDIELEPDIPMSEREAQLSFDTIKAIQEIKTATCKFKTEVHGDGAAGVPFWATVLLPACGFTNAAGVFTPKTEAPGTNVKTLTMALYEDGRKKTMRGAAGNAKFIFETGKLAMIEWEFKGVWVGEATATILAPTYPTNIPFRVAAATFSINAVYSPCWLKMEIDLGNEVEIRPCATNADGSGAAAAIIGDRKIKGTLDPEAALAATYDFWTDWNTPTERALAFSVQDSLDKFAIAAPKLQVMKISAADRAKVIIDEIEFALNKNAGNDALTFTFSAP